MSAAIAKSKVRSCKPGFAPDPTRPGVNAMLSGDSVLERSMAILAESIANGTHSNKSLHVCGVCRQWVDSIFHIGFDGTRMCAACADKIGQGPASLKSARERRR